MSAQIHCRDGAVLEEQEKRHAHAGDWYIDVNRDGSIDYACLRNDGVWCWHTENIPEWVVLIGILADS